MTDSPIAIVGRGCVLPGALDVQELWTRIARGDDLTSPSSADQWLLHPATVCSDPIEPSACARGGYVTGFEAAWRHHLDAAGAVDAAVPVGWKWLALAAAQALRDAGAVRAGRTGLVLGSLGYPTREFADAAAGRWRGDRAVDDTALSAQTGVLHWAMRWSAIDGPRVALDAACASGLYALKIACDRLRDGDADVMLAAGLNAADDLFLHVGFTALGALSPTGRSLPLSTLADGLLPAEGAAVVALKRLDDALAAGDRIYAIVRGVGLSNDGRGAGLLSPSTAGQQRAMRAAYDACGLAPGEIDYLECHATGTQVGDREEIVSIRRVFGDTHPLRLGSLKAQLGHLITASASAALLKLCAMFEHGTIPAVAASAREHPIAALEGSALVLPGAAVPWPAGRMPRRAAIDAFGFGGCNAHAVIEGPEAAADLARRTTRQSLSTFPTADRLAVVACEMAIGAAADTNAALRVLLGLDAPTRRVDHIDLPIAGLGFPPADLQHAVTSQLLLLRAAQAIRPMLSGLDHARVGVYVGTDTDPATARHGFRWRIDQLVGRAASSFERDPIAPPLQAAGVIGTMPNMPANRLNRLTDAGGPGFVVSDGADSGLRALELAARALRTRDLDAAIVGAVDASGAAFGDDATRADAVVLLLVMRAGDVDDQDVIALLEPARFAGPADAASGAAAQTDAGHDCPSLPWPDAGAAAALLDVAIGALCCRHALLPSNPAVPWVAGERRLSTHGWTVRAVAAQGLAVAAPELTGRPHRAGRGELAWVFTGAAAAYPGAGLALARACPDLLDDVRAIAPRLSVESARLLAKSSLTLVEQLQVATLVSQMHARLLTSIGLAPDACLGLSSGETNALLATGAWTDADDLFADIARTGMYDVHLAGRYEVLRDAWQIETPAWRSFRVIHPVTSLRAAVARTERVRLLIVHHDGDAVIGGDDEACRAVIAQLGATAVPIDHDLVVHCPELGAFTETWRRVHRRQTRRIATPRLYANAINAPFTPSSDECADLLTAQAAETVIFDATVRRAYADGARAFVELGPRAACTSWIHQILADRPHVACAIDGTSGALSDVVEALDALGAGGFPIDAESWNVRMRRLRVLTPPEAAAAPRAGMVRLNVHRPPMLIASAARRTLRMPAAPRLVPVLPGLLKPVAAPAAASTATPDTSTALVAALHQTQQALLAVQQLTIAELEKSAKWGRRSFVEDTAVRVSSTNDLRPHFTREQLELHASGRISDLFGPAFVPQDGYRRQVRMPMPPLLLADRVVALQGEPASMGTGTVWTETDVRPDAWYLHHGRMPAGILIESGQADLFLISWLGIDLHNRGDRVYRLLGCELTFHGRLPAIGETLRYEISVDGHARHGDVGLFFFHYDCRSSAGPAEAGHAGDLRLTVRHGQAGFFTDAELAESGGVLLDTDDDRPDAGAPLAGPRPGVTPSSSYNAERVAEFSRGDLRAAFGSAFGRTASHTRTARIPGGRMQLFDRVDVLDPQGGPWGRGYLRATLSVSPDLWFFDGHFHNDPCMPGTLMFEGCLQTMAFYLAALGYSIDRDGWSFEPVPERPYHLRCRGQVTPESRELTYEVFVAELHDGPEPMLVADLLGTVDGLKAFHCRRMALRLVPDAPLSAFDLQQVAPDIAPVAEVGGFRFGHASLLACALGDPTAAFGELYSALPPARRVPRLPAPPYHFITRITAISEPPGRMEAGAIVETAYDIPADAWYFDAHPSRVMPPCALIEAALQPCGWLASYVGCAATASEELFFRNLDGAGVVHRPLRPDDGTLQVTARLTNLSHAGGITLVSFDVACRIGDEVVYELTTTFGFFPKAALEGQTGLSTTADTRARAALRSSTDLLAALDARASGHLPEPPLRMCDRVTHREIAADGSTWLRGEKSIDPGEWFFRAHFFQDPVQPGSLGVDALVQLLQAHLLLEGAASAIADGSFADLARPDLAEQTRHAWTFRGQVLPEASLVTLTLDAEPIDKRADGWHARATGSLWVDGVRIYEVRGLTTSFAASGTARAAQVTRPAEAGHDVPRVVSGFSRTCDLDPNTQPHWRDHRPTYTVPVLPGLALVSFVLDALPGTHGVDDLALRRWVRLDRPRTLTLDADGDRLTFTVDGETVADGRSAGESAAPAIVPPLPSSTPLLDDPYASDAMFHGPAYHRVIAGRRDATGADVTVAIVPDVDGDARVSHFVLDAGLHAIPHDALEQWFPTLASGAIGYPARVERFRLYGPPPRRGTCEVRVRPDGFPAGSLLTPRVHLQYLDGDRLWADLLVVEARLPATRLAQLPAAARRAFLRDGEYVAGARLSIDSAGQTTLDIRDLIAADWLPGTVDAIFGIADDALPPVQAVAAREHAAARLEVHPRALHIDTAGRITTATLPLLDYRLSIGGDAHRAEIGDQRPPALAVAAVRQWWQQRDWCSGEPALQPLFFASARQFAGRLRVVDPEALAAIAGRPMLLVANHQVAIESMLAGIVLPPVLGLPLTTIAKHEHRETWVGRLAVGLNDDRHGPALLLVDRSRPDDLLARIDEIKSLIAAGRRSIMVHVEGTRARRGRQRVSTISSVWSDLAIAAGLPIVPLRFCHGLPAAGVGHRLEFPLGFGGQTMVVGRPIAASALAPLPLHARRDCLVETMAELERFDGEPHPDAAFAARVARARQRWALDDVAAVFLLLQADAHAWPLDDDGLPAEAMGRRDPGDPFWAWFERNKDTVHS